MIDTLLIAGAVVSVLSGLAFGAVALFLTACWAAVILAVFVTVCAAAVVSVCFWAWFAIEAVNFLSAMATRMNAFVSSFPFLGSFQSSKSVTTSFKSFTATFTRTRSILTMAASTSAPSANKTDDRPLFATLFPGGRAPVLANDGKEVNLVSVVQSKPGVVLLGWLRHYGCTLCKKQASDWLRLRETIDAANLAPVSLVLIGNGQPHQAADFAQEMGWKEDLFSDPERSTYAALAFNKGLTSLLTLPSLRKTIASFREGNSQTLSRIPTDPLQQGGALLVDANGEVVFFHRDAAAGDHAPIDELVDAIRDALP